MNPPIKTPPPTPKAPPPPTPEEKEPKVRPQSQVDEERGDWEGMGQSRYQPEMDAPQPDHKDER